MKKLALFAILIFSAALSAQDATKTPIHFTCTSTEASTVKVEMDLDRDPIDALRVLISNIKPTSADTTAPVITSVFYSGSTAPVESVKIPATSVSVQFSVSGSDDVGVQSFVLYVDGALVSSGNGGTQLLAANGQAFAVRWNAAVIPAGSHSFKLVVYDAATNPSAARVWQMVK